MIIEQQKLNPPDIEQTDVQEPRPWNFWPTVGFSIIILAVFFLFQIIVVSAFVIVALCRNPKLDPNQLAESLSKNGLILAAAVCVATPFTIGVTLIFAKIRKGMTIRNYLGFNHFGWKEIFKWCLVAILFMACMDTLTYLIGKPIVPAFMVDTYKTARFLPLLWFALIVAGPLNEEILFRGFMFKGIESSRLGPVGAIIITSLAWSIIHIQYDLYGISCVFLGGFLLGFMRFKSNSIYPSIAVHAFQNIIATIEVVIHLRFFPDLG